MPRINNNANPQRQQAFTPSTQVKVLNLTNSAPYFTRPCYATPSSCVPETPTLTKASMSGVGTPLISATKFIA